MTQGKIIAKQGSRNITRNRFEKRDIINTMPNEIIGNILSRLTVKEAARTSVLSTAWRYQWTYFSGVLDFDHSLRTYLLRREHVGLLTKCMVFVCEWERFMTHLEHVMKTLKSPSMQGLRICMDLGNPWKVAEWVKFAAEKNVRTLDLDFSYNFTEPFFEVSDTIRNVLSPKSFEMKSLCVLRLASVDVSGETIQCFLASCPLLETLCVIESQLLGRLKVCGPALRLKHLELVECNILYLDIYAENLMTFRYSGDYGKFNFESFPSLVEASFGGRYASYLQSNMDDADFYGVLSQVHVLKLELSAYHQGTLEGLPVFGNVKQLELEIPHVCGAELDCPVSLLSAFPSICVLKIKFLRSNLGEAEQEWKASLKHEYPSLRELEVSGYRRDSSQIELLISIFAKAPNLNRIVVDPLSSFYVDRSPDVKARIRKMRRESTIWFVDALKPHVPPPVELIVL
ncbi:F-box/LRR-repeat protein [Spatholobus suberectus]|nr:F-box/LRR-repeat protein [Spatholobus suberectus]